MRRELKEMENVDKGSKALLQLTRDLKHLDLALPECVWGNIEAIADSLEAVSHYLAEQVGQPTTERRQNHG